MKKSISKALALLTIFTVACTENTLVENSPIVNNSDTITEISITGKDFQFEGDTRSSVSVSESGVSFLWDEDDVIGIFPDKGDQVSFAMEQGAGTQTATFTGGGWALKSSATYAAYYPHVYENRDLTKIPISYVGQTQNGNANTDHIGAYDFMATSVTTPSNGAVAFDMQHLGALVQLTVTIPQPSTLKKIVLSSSSNFTQTGTINLTADTPAITADTQSNTFEIALNNVATTEVDEIVTVYFIIAPIDLTDCELTATIHFADDGTREVELTGKNLQAGKAYKFSINHDLIDYIDEYGINHGKGVEIDGVIWAPVNCGYHKSDFSYGKLYQWGRKYGQGYAGKLYDGDGNSIGNYSDAIQPTLRWGAVDISTGQSEDTKDYFYGGSAGTSDWLHPQNDKLWNSGQEDSPTKTEYDPCPEGWRVPLFSELKGLWENEVSWVKDSSDKEGLLFSDINANTNTICQFFLPAAGFRSGSGEREAKYRGREGNYWSSKPYNYSTPPYYTITYHNANYIYFTISGCYFGHSVRANGYSVRCVQE